MKLHGSMIATSLLVITGGLMLYASPQSQMKPQPNQAQTQAPANTAPTRRKHSKAGASCDSIKINPKNCTVNAETLRVYQHLNPVIVWELQEPSSHDATIAFKKGPTPGGPLSPCIDMRHKGKDKTFREKFTVSRRSRRSQQCTINTDPNLMGSYTYEVHGLPSCPNHDPSVDVQN